MTVENNTLWNEVIEDLLLHVRSLDPSSKEYGDAVNNLVALQKVETEDRKNQMEVEEKYERRQMEERQLTAEQQARVEEYLARDRQMKMTKRLEVAKNVIEVVGLLGTSGIYLLTFITDLKAEEVYTPTNSMVRGALNKIKPGKK